MKIKMLSSKQYAAKRGAVCPKCGSSNLNGDEIEMDDAIVWQNVTCCDCGAYWTDEYTLTGYGNFHVQDEDLCSCANRSWYGKEHDTACALTGERA